MDRLGDWMETYSGVKFWAIDPEPEEILITDIAHALSQICRFSGHTKFFYSVGQHCIHCAEVMEKSGFGLDFQLYALLHDASEAYICDIPSPVKPYISGYHEVEEKLQNMIYEKFGLSSSEEYYHRAIKIIDKAVLMEEAKVLMNNTDNWIKEVLLIETEIKYEDMASVEIKYLELFNKLKGKYS